jgi:hypothetical protein
MEAGTGPYLPSELSVFFLLRLKHVYFLGEELSMCSRMENVIKSSG